MISWRSHILLLTRCSEGVQYGLIIIAYCSSSMYLFCYEERIWKKIHILANCAVICWFLQVRTKTSFLSQLLKARALILEHIYWIGPSLKTGFTAEDCATNLVPTLAVKVASLATNQTVRLSPGVYGIFMETGPGTNKCNCGKQQLDTIHVIVLDLIMNQNIQWLGYEVRSCAVHCMIQVNLCILKLNNESETWSGVIFDSERFIH